MLLLLLIILLLEKFMKTDKQLAQSFTCNQAES